MALAFKNTIFILKLQNMKLKKKINNFIWNDLPLRLSTHIIIWAGIIPIFLCAVMMYEKNANTSIIWIFIMYVLFVLPITSLVVLILFIIELNILKFRLKFYILSSKFFKIITLIFYALSLICSYIAFPAMCLQELCGL